MSRVDEQQIESEQKRLRLTERITRWCEHTKTLPLLRDGDIPGLVRSILEEFYHIHLSCGHMVREMDEGVDLTYKENDGTVSGIYCRVCAEWYKKELGAWEE